MELTDKQREYLLKAADEIDRRGITHGQGSDEGDKATCAVCTAGALALVVVDSPDDWDDAYGECIEYTDLINAIGDEFPGEFRDGVFDEYPLTPLPPLLCIVNWNDKYRVTKEEASAKLREIAAS